jgi:hypothetical protein
MMTSKAASTEPSILHLNVADIKLTNNQAVMSSPSSVYEQHHLSANEIRLLEILPQQASNDQRV